MPNKPAASSLLTLLLILALPLFLFPSVAHYIFSLPLRLVIPSVPPTSATPPTMSWLQKQFTLPSKSRGSYLITDHVVQQIPEIKDYKVGLLNLFVQHTSCALSLNENWDEEVREDMSDALDRIAPEDRKGNLYRHSAEGLDDMPVCVWRCRRPTQRETLMERTGAYQERVDWRECHGADQGWAAGDGDVAGHLVFGVPGEQA